MLALTIFTIVASIVGIALVGIMGIIVAYEVTPLDEMPNWLDKAYDRVEKVLDKIFY
jgi:xanthosine utilization system XapX-like protein